MPHVSCSGLDRPSRSTDDLTCPRGMLPVSDGTPIPVGWDRDSRLELKCVTPRWRARSGFYIEEATPLGICQSLEDDVTRRCQ
jgi:hypothetical protein